MFMVNKLYLELLFTNLVTNTSGGKEEKNSLISRRQKFTARHIQTHTHTHTPTQYFGGFYTCYLGHNWVLYPYTPLKKEPKKRKSQFYPPPINLENPPFTPDVQSVCTMVAFHQPHKACSDRCHQHSPSIGITTGRLTGLFPIVVNTQSAPLWIPWIRLWKKV